VSFLVIKNHHAINSAFRKEKSIRMSQAHDMTIVVRPQRPASEAEGRLKITQKKGGTLTRPKASKPHVGLNLKF